MMSILYSVNWDAVTAIATVALVVTGIVALIYAGVQIHDFRKETRIKHLTDLVDQFEREPIATYRRQTGAGRISCGKLQKLDLDNPPPGIHDVLNFFEHMGFLLDGGYIDIEAVSVEFHYWITHIWADARELIKDEQSDDPMYYEFFDKMVKRLLEYDRPETGKVTLPSQSEIEDFYLEEAHLPTGAPLPRQKRKRRSVHPRVESQSPTSSREPPA